MFDGLGRAGVAAEVARAGRDFRGGDGDVDDDVLHVGDGAQAGIDLAFEVEGDLGVGRGEVERHARGAVDEGGGFDQAEGHDVAAEAGVFDLLEVFLEGVGCHGRIKTGGNGIGVERSSGGVNR